MEHRGELVADFFHFYGSSPSRLWASGAASLFDIAAMAVNLPRNEQSATGRALNPDHEWTLQNQLLALAVDELRLLVWQNTADGEKGRNMPDPIPRPGVEPVGDVVGSGEGFDTPADFSAWYLEMYPDMSGRI